MVQSPVLGLCNTGSNHGQSKFQIAAEGSSPEHRGIRSNDARLHYISQMLMEDDDDERAGSCRGEATLQATEKSFRDILGQVYPPATTNQPSSHSNDKSGNPGEHGNDGYNRLCGSGFSNDCSTWKAEVINIMPSPLAQ